MTSSSDATGDTEDPTGTSGESTAEGVLGSSSGETEDTEGETSIPTLAKTLLRDLVPDLAAAGGLVPEKLESVAILASGDFYIANDNDGVSVGNGETQLLNLGNILDGNASPPERTARPATFQRIATFPICMQIDAACDTEEETVAEITAATDDGMMLVYTDGPSSRIGFVDITDPQAPQAAGLVELEGEPTSAAVHGDHVLVAVNLSDGNFEEPSGALVVIDLESRAIVETFPLEGQPDSIAVSPDGTYAAIIIENERDEDIHDGELPQLPGGWLSVVDVSADDVSAWTIDTVDLSLDDSFYGFEDPEPEFVDVNENNIAVVTLQENNGIALVDLETRAVISTFSAGEVDLDLHVVAPGERHDVRVEQRVALLLPAVGVEALAEVAVPVEQTDPDERDAQVARRLEVVTGEHAEPTGVLGYRFGDAELGREVGHEVEGAVALGLEPAVALQVALQLAAHLAEEPLEPGVAGQGVEPLARHEAEQAHRVVDAGVPQVGVDPAEQVAGAVVPRPPQVERQRLQERQRLGESGTDREAPQRAHAVDGSQLRRLRPPAARSSPGRGRSGQTRSVDDDTANEVEEVIRRRRTSLVVDRDRPVDPGLVNRLIGSAIWAPNRCARLAYTPNCWRRPTSSVT